ncbi:MAG TPA: hypothetical protein VF862_03705 [Gemmatimonadales bacterium]
MNGFAGRSEFFRREAGDYLRELGPLVTEGAPAPGNAFPRLARALRGAAMLAGPPTYTRAARQLEQVAKLVPEGRLSWEIARPVLREAVAEFHRLTEFAQAWDATRDGEAEAVERRLLALTGTAALTPEPGREPRGDGLRAFVGREVTVLAAAVAGAAEAIATDPASAQPALAGARAAMQSLHGLAGLSDLAPLGDVLDTLDILLADVVRHPSVPPEAAEVLRLAAATLRTLAEAVTQRGRPHDLATMAGFVEGVFDQFARGPGTVAIDELLLAGADGPLTGALTAPASPIDLASLGERLRSGAAQLRTAPDPLTAALRGFGLLTTIRGAPGGLGQEPAGAFLAGLARCLERPDALEDGDLVAIIDQAGEHLASGSDHRNLSALLGTLTARLPRGEPVVPIEALAPDTADGVVPIEALAPDEGEPVVPIEALAPDLVDDVVPIEALAPDEGEPVVPIEALAPDSVDEVVPIEALAPDDAEPVVPIEALAPAPEEELPSAPPPPAPFPGLMVPADRTRLEQTLTAYSRLVAANAPVLPLEALIPPAVPPLVTVGSRSAAIEIEAEFDVVPIESLLYRGPGAMTRADDVRRQLEDALKVASTELDRVEPLVRELLDLVPLAVADGR